MRYRDQSYRNSKLEIRYPGSRFGSAFGQALEYYFAVFPQINSSRF